jgi:hypothetical protein
MTVPHKIFWFFAACLVLKMIIPGSQTEKVADPVPNMSREAQCETSKWYVRYWTYDGQPVAKETIQCFNNLVIRTEKM